MLTAMRDGCNKTGMVSALTREAKEANALTIVFPGLVLPLGCVVQQAAMIRGAVA